MLEYPDAERRRFKNQNAAGERAKEQIKCVAEVSLFENKQQVWGSVSRLTWIGIEESASQGCFNSRVVSDSDARAEEGREKLVLSVDPSRDF